VIAPAGLMPTGTVDVEPGVTSNVVKVPAWAAAFFTPGAASTPSVCPKDWAGAWAGQKITKVADSENAKTRKIAFILVPPHAAWRTVLLSCALRPAMLYLSRSACSTCLASSRHCRETSMNPAFTSGSYACAAKRSHSFALSRYRLTRGFKAAALAHGSLFPTHISSHSLCNAQCGSRIITPNKRAATLDELPYFKLRHYRKKADAMPF
jgi:hypothetical protein